MSVFVSNWALKCINKEATGGTVTVSCCNQGPNNSLKKPKQNNKETSHDADVSQPSHTATRSGEFQKFSEFRSRRRLETCPPSAGQHTRRWRASVSSRAVAAGFTETERQKNLPKYPRQRATSLHSQENKPPSSGVTRSSASVNTQGCSLQARLHLKKVVFE